MSDSEQRQPTEQAKARAKKAAALARAEGVKWGDLTNEQRKEWKRKVAQQEREGEKGAHAAS